jgi:hypothetical protein
MGASPAEPRDAESAAGLSTESQVSCRIGVANPSLYVLSSSPVDKEAVAGRRPGSVRAERGPCADPFWKTDIFLPDGRIRGFLFERAVGANG